MPQPASTIYRSHQAIAWSRFVWSDAGPDELEIVDYR